MNEILPVVESTIKLKVKDEPDDNYNGKEENSSWNIAIKKEPNDCCAGGEENSSRKIFIKLEEHILGLPEELYCNTEEEQVKRPFTVLISPTEEFQERPEEEEKVRPEEHILGLPEELDCNTEKVRREEHILGLPEELHCNTEKVPLAVSTKEVVRVHVKEEKREEKFLSVGAGATFAGNGRQPAPATTTTTVHPAARTVADIPASVSSVVAASPTTPPVGAGMFRIGGKELRRLKCHVCGMPFIGPATLVTHMRKHAPNRTFMCDHCGKTFAVRNHLQVHLRIHTCDRLFMC